MEAASAITQAVRSKVIGYGDHVMRRKQQQEHAESESAAVLAGLGWVHRLPEKELEVLIEVARVTSTELRQVDSCDHAALQQYHKERRKRNEADELTALFTRYALALSYFERWQRHGVKSMQEVRYELANLDRVQHQLDWLRDQIDMRSVGLSWVDFAGQWSSSTNEAVGTVSQLQDHLGRILQEERDQELPSRSAPAKEACPAPLMKRKSFKQLGTPTVQADELSNERIDLTQEEYLRGAEKRREEVSIAVLCE